MYKFKPIFHQIACKRTVRLFAIEYSTFVLCQHSMSLVNMAFTGKRMCTVGRISLDQLTGVNK